MKKFYSLLMSLLICLFFACDKPKNAELTPENYLKSILTEGKKNVNIMKLGLPANETVKLNQIITKMKSSIAQNMEWYSGYLKNLKTGSPMPYHKNLGISQADYEFFLNSSKNMKIFKSGEGIIEIKKNNNGFSITSMKDIKYFNNIMIDLQNNTIKTDYGVLKYKSKIDASDSQVIGRWKGYSWKLEEANVNLENFDMTKIDKNTYIKLIQIHIGQMEQDSTIFIGMKVYIIKNGNLMQEDEMFQY